MNGIIDLPCSLPSVVWFHGLDLRSSWICGLAAWEGVSSSSYKMWSYGTAALLQLMFVESDSSAQVP